MCYGSVSESPWVILASRKHSAILVSIGSSIIDELIILILSTRLLFKILEETSWTLQASNIDSGNSDMAKPA